MTEEALLLAIQDKLQAAVWTGGSNVFHDNSVIISAAPELKATGKLIMPICIVRPLDAQADPDQPDFYKLNIELVVAVSISGDALGQSALMGANRTANSSKGAGLIQVQEAVFDTINKLNAAESITLQHTYSSAAAPIQLSERVWVNARSYVFETWINH